MRTRHGITRTVFVFRTWVVKVPSWRHRSLVRGWLANRSEWRQRHKPNVCRPALTVFHMVVVYPRAHWVGVDSGRGSGPWVGRDGDEGKASSWGRFRDRWLLIDFDAAWEHPRGLVGGIYYWNQERLGRKWAQLPQQKPDLL